MLRTLVCEKEGCTGNKFYVKSDGGNLYIKCKECGEEYCYDVSYYDYKILSSCSNCGNDLFKIFKDTDKEGIYIKCSECGSPPEKIYVDDDGNQVTYEEKKLEEMKNMIYGIDQKINDMNNTINQIKNDQEFLEESMAYLNKFIASKN